MKMVSVPKVAVPLRPYACCDGRAIITPATKTLWLWKLYDRPVAHEWNYGKPFPREGILAKGRAKTRDAAFAAAVATERQLRARPEPGPFDD